MRAAVIMACVSIGRILDSHRTGALCVDNQAAVGALVKGSSTSPLGALLTHLFRTCDARGTALWWIGYVRAKSNIADLPSRDCASHAGTNCGNSTGAASATFRDAFKSWGDIRRETTMAQESER